MTNEYLALILGTIWVAPHVHRWYALLVGMVYIAIHLFIKLGVL
jgi:hypothetical protein